MLEAGLAEPCDRQRLLALGTAHFAVAAGLITLDVPTANPERCAAAKRCAFPKETQVEAWLAFALPTVGVGDELGRRIFEEVVVPLAGMLGESIDDADAAADRIASCVADQPDDGVVQILGEEIGAAAAGPMAHPVLLEVATALRAMSDSGTSVGHHRRDAAEALPA